ncbi:hypothetical protein FZC84_14595 [Rossellomorea vietnamensis]|uniref:Uncharacterized protein n=1 Tax=Rossellomorea vietnamensis TaxID=218284 RepID=A0A5D4MBQ8_9BACI|nr:hypothetical protein FZC84_14595 [Rossellomorea vietnamensis]
MKNYIAFLLQLIIWSAFSVAQWLSGKDHIEYKWIMFIVFFYLGYLIAKKIVNSSKVTFIVTLISLFTFFSLKIFFEQIITSIYL